MLLALGSNGAGQLGLGHTDDVSEPQRVDLDEAQHGIRRIVAGGNHSILLLSHGTAFATGNNTDGRCGIATQGNITSFQRVALRDDDAKSALCFSDAAATWSASYFVAEDRVSIHVCGTGEHGELGLGRDVVSALSGRITMPDTIVSIAACMAHVVAVLANGEVWAWGKGRQGQLGMPAEDSWFPRKINMVGFEASRAVCGVDFTCILSRPEEGRILTLGSEKRDRFGIVKNTPLHIQGWQDVVASWGSIMVRMPNDTVVAWGRNDRGQLPPALPQIRGLAAGSEHWLALTSLGQVLSGGWGEHGNCGEPKDVHGVVKGRWNVLCAAGAQQIFAGCATSFIVTTDAEA